MYIYIYLFHQMQFGLLFEQFVGNFCSFEISQGISCKICKCNLCIFIIFDFYFINNSFVHFLCLNLCRKCVYLCWLCMCVALYVYVCA